MNTPNLPLSSQAHTKLLNPALLTAFSFFILNTIHGDDRVNWAKFQSAFSDSAQTGSEAAYVTDGVVNAANAWRSASASGGHWIGVTLPESREIGSIQLFLGDDDTGTIANFSLNYDNGSGMQPLPGGQGNFTGNTDTAVNLVLSSPITVKDFMLYTTEVDATVREIALLPPNGGSGWPTGTDTSLHLARQRIITSTSVDGSNFEKLAVDGYVGPNDAWRSENVNGPHSLTLNLGTEQRVAGVHVYTGSASENAVANFSLLYWNGSDFVDCPGGVITGNSQTDLAVNFTSPVQTSTIIMYLPDNGQQVVRELVPLPATAGVSSFPLGTSIQWGDAPDSLPTDIGDGWYQLQNRETAAYLSAGQSTTGATEAQAHTPTDHTQFQILYNIDSDTYRIRNRDTFLCLQSPEDATSGDPVELADYSAQPNQLWKISDAGSGYGQYINVWSGLALQTDELTPATITLTTPSSLWSQHWALKFDTHYQKKGVGDYNPNRDEWEILNASWYYKWGQTPWNPTGWDLTENVTFGPMQWGLADIEQLAVLGPLWLRQGSAVTLMGFNEPDLDDGGGSDVQVAEAVDHWPELEATNLPLLSPAVAVAFGQWQYDFFGAVDALGYRVDYTGVHWYGTPDAPAFISYLEGIYNTFGRPLWITEFSTTDWSGTATWTEEDNFRFLSEFVWMAEDKSWIKRYSIFPDYGAETADPWTPSAPVCRIFNPSQELTPVGDMYAGWDGEHALSPTQPYYLHGKGASFRLGNDGSGGLMLHSIRSLWESMQWILIPTAANPDVYYIASVADGQRLRSNGSNIELASAAATGSDLEWTLTAADAKGYFYIDCSSQNKRLRLNRSNDGNGAPTSVSTSLDSGMTATDDWVCWRLVKPATPGDLVEDALPSWGWSVSDIAEPAIAGYCYIDFNTWTWMVGGSGADIYGTYDQFQLTSRDYSGDGMVAARVVSIDPTHAYAKSGVMMRDSLQPDAAYASIMVTSNSVSFEYRSTAGGNVQTAGSASLSAPVWLRLIRTGNSFTAYYRTDGSSWSQLGGAQTIALASTVRAGLAVTSHDNARLNSSVFTDVTVDVASDATPPAAPGSFSATAGDGSVTLDWADNSEPDMASYSLYRSTTSGSGYAAIATGLTSSDYIDNSVSNGTTYYYVVTALDTNFNESTYSSEANATPVDTTPPAAPGSFSASAGDGSVTLNWADNSEPDMASYSLYRSITSGSGYAAIATGLTSSDYIDNSVSNGTTYYYVVTALDTNFNE
uniref:glycosyl hydrolase n=1 Tax=Coraliomargarita parva TaxID=3014050 RepID=UPI0022B2B153